MAAADLAAIRTDSSTVARRREHLLLLDRRYRVGDRRLDVNLCCAAVAVAGDIWMRADLDQIADSSAAGRDRRSEAMLSSNGKSVRLSMTVA